MPAGPRQPSRDGTSGRPQCTLFKNPFKTWEAFTERNRGIRMGFSRITATIGAPVRSLGPSRHSALCLLCPATRELGGLQGSPNPFRARMSRALLGPWPLFPPSSRVSRPQRVPSPHHAHIVTHAQDHTGPQEHHHKCGRLCMWPPEGAVGTHPKGRCSALWMPPGWDPNRAGPPRPPGRTLHTGQGQGGVWAKAGQAVFPGGAPASHPSLCLPESQSARKCLAWHCRHQLGPFHP